MKKIILLIGLVLVVSGCVANFQNQTNLPGSNNDGQAGKATSSETSDKTGGKACTQEAKLCPDGSAVGRIGPNCEFAPCPGEKNDCTCPIGYYLETSSCNPDCYKSTPRCLMPSIPCTPLKKTKGSDNGDTGNGQAGMANPASVYCTEHGGESVIVTNPDGSQRGNCVLPGGKTCDEWEYYRGTCQ